MANTGYKQATVVYKISTPGDQPLDINGGLCSVSGLKQAIGLLEGTPNPNPNKYEVEFYFMKGATVEDSPTVEYNPSFCPVGYIRVTPNRLVFDPTNISAIVTLESSAPWVLFTSLNIATVSIKKGRGGRYYITIQRTGTVGQGEFIFKNLLTGQTATIYVINVVTKPWVLDTGAWNMLGFWYNNSIWKYNP